MQFCILAINMESMKLSQKKFPYGFKIGDWNLKMAGGFYWRLNIDSTSFRCFGYVPLSIFPLIKPGEDLNSIQSIITSSYFICFCSKCGRAAYTLAGDFHIR